MELLVIVIILDGDVSEQQLTERGRVDKEEDRFVYGLCCQLLLYTPGNLETWRIYSALSS